ncbi:MAG: hypothetical protein MZV63_39790 [Marinilabiliales bacterium]|nr:hypothetical protein [Marinilabiliales bacterium]
MMSTNRGITKFDPQNKEFFNFGLSDGLQNLEYNIGAYYKAKDGETYFGGISGLNAFIPIRLKREICSKY